jgi:hypothetical protein
VHTALGQHHFAYFKPVALAIVLLGSVCLFQFDFGWFEFVVLQKDDWRDFLQFYAADQSLNKPEPRAFCHWSEFLGGVKIAVIP